MAITVTCKCGQSHQVKDQFAGQETNCPYCREPLHIPEKEKMEEKPASSPPVVIQTEKQRCGALEDRDAIAKKIAAQHGMSPEEFDAVIAPQFAELNAGMGEGIFVRKDKPKHSGSITAEGATKLIYEKQLKTKTYNAKEKNREKIANIVAGILAVLLIGGFLVFLATIFIGDYMRKCEREAMAATFSSHLSEYVSIGGLTEDNEGQPYVTGKVVLVDIQPDAKISVVKQFKKELKKTTWEEINRREFYELSPDLRATTPEEVGTIIWIKWDLVVEGFYSSPPRSACRITCEITVIDKDKATIVGKTVIRGTSPPSAVKTLHSGYGNRPTKKIVDYIESLPRTKKQ